MNLAAKGLASFSPAMLEAAFLAIPLGCEIYVTLKNMIDKLISF